MQSNEKRTEASAKKAYATPKLTTFGSVETLTLHKTSKPSGSQVYWWQTA